MTKRFLFTFFLSCIVFPVSYTYAAVELCGDGVDNDASGYTKGACPTGWMDAVYAATGCDLKCPAPDQDHDGYTTTGAEAWALGIDCDDSNKTIYPNVSVACGTAGWKTCQTSGSYTACSETELCEATASGDCYYVDAVNGSDANAGTTRATAWKTIAAFSTYSNGSAPPDGQDECSTTKPAGYHSLVAGDVVYFLNGTYDEIVHNYEGDGNCSTRSLLISSKSDVIIKAYPGHLPVINTDFQAGVPGIEIYEGDNIRIQGITITNNDNGILVSGGTDISISGNKIVNNDGTNCGDNNCSGVKISNAANTVLVQNNYIFDNYGRSAPTNANNTNIVSFAGTGLHYDYNTTGYTDTNDLMCFKYKHGQVDADNNTIKGNVFLGCGVAMGTSQPNLDIEYNRIIQDSNQPVFVLANLGGNTYLHDINITRNTVILGDTAGSVLYENSADLTTTPSNIVFTGNVVHSANSAWYDAGGLSRLDEYSTDTTCDQIKAAVTINNNCYYNTQSTYAWRACGSNSPTAGKQVQVTSLAAWQTAVSQDANSYVENATLDDSNRATSTNCADKGWLLLSEEVSGGSSSSSSSSSSSAAAFRIMYVGY